MSATFDIRIFLGSLFLLLGLMSLAIAGWLSVKNAELLQHGDRQPGIVVALRRSNSPKKRSFYPIVRFQTPDGQSHEIHSNLGSRPARYQIGESVSVIYPPNQPSDASINGFLELWFGVLVAGIIGFVSTAFGIYNLWAHLKYKQLQTWLKQHGVRISTKITHIEVDKRYRLNGRHPFQIISEGMAPLASSPQRFRSQHIWKDPTLVAPVGTSIDAFVDPNDPRRSWMDVSLITR